tara:strand:+ start:788 stop:1828 length:1041 start_codon:yes stop_codon:yes gene_type:complete
MLKRRFPEYFNITMNIKSYLAIGVFSFSTLTVSSYAQTTVATDPVGVVTAELPATGFHYLGINLTSPILLTSSSTTLNGDEVDSGIDLSILEVGTSYVMEIVDGVYEGFSADIASWNGQVITLTEDIAAAGVTTGQFNGSRITIRTLPTIASIFGPDNSAGLKAGSLANADRIYIYENGVFKKHYYFPGGLGVAAGWRDEDGNDSANTIVHFGDGLIIETKDSAPKSVSVSGTVKLGPTNVPLYAGFNLLSNPSPVPGNLTLANSGIADGIQAGSAATGDIVYIPSTSGFEKYYYFPGGLGVSAGWRNVDTGAISNDVELPSNGSFFIDRKGGSTSVTISEDLPNN